MTDNQVFLSVQSAYDRWSAAYDGYDNPMVFAATQVVAANIGDVVGTNIFEFGCGTGRNLAALKSAGAASVSGCDLSEGMLQIARERDASFKVFQHDMSLPLDVPAHSTDLALFCLTLEHIEKLLPPLQEAKRIVRNGGRIEKIEIHPFMSIGGVSAHFQDAGEEVRMPTFPHQFSDYLNVIAELSLKLKSCREWRPRDFGTPAPLKALKRGEDFPLVVQFSIEV